jgi:hypothetical protein
MTENTDNAPFDPALGAIEPHAGTLTAPPDGQQLYKIMTIENLLRSVSGGYLYFNRVDSYTSGMPTGMTVSSCNKIAPPMRPPSSKGHPISLATIMTAAETDHACCFSLEN